MPSDLIDFESRVPERVVDKETGVVSYQIPSQPPPDSLPPVAELTEREKTQAAQIMTLMAEKSTLETELERVKELIRQHYRDNEGHNHCWRNNPRLWEGIGLIPKQLTLPPRAEAEHGCKVFWDQLYSEPSRYPDFIPVNQGAEA